jgi:hypothetical protein
MFCASCRIQAEQNASESLLLLGGCAEARERLLKGHMQQPYLLSTSVAVAYNWQMKAANPQILPLPLMEPLLLVLAEIQLLQPQEDLVDRWVVTLLLLLLLLLEPSNQIICCKAQLTSSFSALCAAFAAAAAGRSCELISTFLESVPFINNPPCSPQQQQQQQQAAQH